MRSDSIAPVRGKAVVLLSGGLDSAVSLYFAIKDGFECFALSFDYGQRHKKEIACARKIAQSAKCALQALKINLPWKGSALLTNLPLPAPSHLRGAKAFAPSWWEGAGSGTIPATYVPGRNIIFLSFALSCAEAIGARAIFIGANAIDFSGYPDCRPGFFRAFNRVAAVGTKAGIEKRRIEIIAPLLKKTKSEIVRLGNKLGVPFGLTWSCYKGASVPCGKCDSCKFRAKGFREAGIKDPLLRS